MCKWPLVEDERGEREIKYKGEREREKERERERKRGRERGEREESARQPDLPQDPRGGRLSVASR